MWLVVEVDNTTMSAANILVASDTGCPDRGTVSFWPTLPVDPCTSRTWSMHVASLLITLFAAGIVNTTRAQTHAPEAPYISRVCLWNADKETWRALDLKRAQVNRLAELRKQYPAVVDGQWMLHDDEVRIPRGIWAGGPAVDPMAAKMPTDEALQSICSNTPSFTSLQNDLRKVLSVEQLRSWERMCGGQ